MLFMPQHAMRPPTSLKSTTSVYAAGQVTLYRTSPTVTAAPPAGSYAEAQLVTLTTDETANIYYTTDDTDPTVDSTLYTEPIPINAGTTLRTTAVDAAGNKSPGTTHTCLIGTTDITVHVATDRGALLSGIKVYVFTAAGAYTGKYAVTDDNGQANFSLPEVAFKVRIDYLDRPYWSRDFTGKNTSVHIFMADALVTVTSGGLPQPGINVYLFSTAGTYLGLFKTTDAHGTAAFDLADGTYTFRIDYLGHQFWSDPVSVPDVMTADITIGHAATEVTVTTRNSPLEDANVYLFSETDEYLGLYRVTGTDGRAAFNLLAGIGFKFRAVILGNQYWTNSTGGDSARHCTAKSGSLALCTTSFLSLRSDPAVAGNALAIRIAFPLAGAASASFSGPGLPDSLGKQKTGSEEPVITAYPIAFPGGNP
ncbi:MAG: chitobiase/beta-hexosaminidase C-terminal domain-containing protein [Desulfobacterales bacterium]|jgi:hypothetical protein|nr:chitobiase/beta-hexosaminidase C-terminal domain-containing protein [Desulfobacterales bacterium]